MRIADAGVPVVFIDRETTDHWAGGPDGGFDTVLVDNRRLARRRPASRAAGPHGRVAIISGPDTSTPGRERLEGFRDAMEHAGLEVRPEHIEFGAFRTREGYQAMLRLMGAAVPPSAVFVANNLMTIGALQALRDLSVVVPDEISVDRVRRSRVRGSAGRSADRGPATHGGAGRPGHPAAAEPDPGSRHRRRPAHRPRYPAAGPRLVRSACDVPPRAQRAGWLTRSGPSPCCPPGTRGGVPPRPSVDDGPEVASGTWRNQEDDVS